MKLKTLFITLITVTGLMGCGGYKPSGGIASSSSIHLPDGTVPVYVMVPLSWEKQAPDGPEWSAFLFQTILTTAPNLLDGPADVGNFCANYSNLTNYQRANFWAYLISEVSLYESGYNPSSRYTETTMGTDPITGKQVVSEGLLQLSYQDTTAYSACQFNWAADSTLPATSPKKTILDPFINLQCGVIILNHQVGVKKALEMGSGAYWSTLKSNSKNNKLTEIKAATQKLAFCAPQ